MLKGCRGKKAWGRRGDVGTRERDEQRSCLLLLKDRGGRSGLGRDLTSGRGGASKVLLCLFGEVEGEGENLKEESKDSSGSWRRVGSNFRAREGDNGGDSFEGKKRIGELTTWEGEET